MTLALAGRAAAQQNLVILTAALPPAVQGQPYVIQLQAAGGKPRSYRWRVVEGSLPAGLRLHPHTGVIEGTPRQSGSFTVTVRVRSK